jgi:hypothetical protein
MRTKIVRGSVFISDATARPASCEVEKLSLVPGWGCVTNHGDAELPGDSAGWTFFYMAGEIRSTSSGRNDQARTERSLRCLLGAAGSGPSKCLQITDINRRSFAGIPYVSLVARARDIPKSRFCNERPNSTLPGMPSVE